MPTVTTDPLRAKTRGQEVTIVENTSGADTGHVVLGVLGGLALVLFLVCIIVPLVRWRRRRAGWTTGSERSASLSTARRAHVRLPSGAPAAAREANLPLLEAQPVMAEKAPAQPSMSTVPNRKTEPSRPRTIELGWKILRTLPSFDHDDESSLSSLGHPLATSEKISAKKPTLRRVSDVRLSAALPPIPPIDSGAAEHDQPSRQSTLVAQSMSSPATLTLPLTNAFQTPLTPVASDPSPSHTNGGSFIHYPSVVASSDSSKNSDARVTNQAFTSTNVTSTPSASWVPRDLVPDADQSSALKSSTGQPETWWRKAPMSPIPEASGSSLAHSSMLTATPTFADAPPSTARLRDSQASAAKSSTRQARASNQTGSTISRSNTQQTNHSLTGSVVDRDRPLSNITAATFGGPGRADDIISQPLPNSNSNSVPFPASTVLSDVPAGDPEGADLRSRFSTNTTTRDEEMRDRRVSRDYPREPSPPPVHTPLSHPPVLRFGSSTPSPRLGSLPPLQQETVPQRQSISLPQPLPQSPDENEVPEAGPSRVSVYGHNEEASNSSEQLIPEDVEPEQEYEPLRLELPGLRPLSPLQLDFRLADPSPAPSSRGSGSKRRNARGGAHVKSASKSTTTTMNSSKRSLRSLASAISGSVRSRASSLSRSRERSGSAPASRSGSKSRSRERDRDRDLVRNHSRRVTFGEPPDSPPPPIPADRPDDVVKSLPSLSGKPARRPLPALPLTSPVSPSTAYGPPNASNVPRHDFDVP